MNQIELFFEGFMKVHEQFLVKDRNQATYFNPLRLFNDINNENTHSNILSWLFDPLASHSQGDLFFRAFLNHFHYNVSYDERDYTVVREFSGIESIVDILIYGKQFIFYIENKTLSQEGEDQTNREYRDMLRLAKSLGIVENSHAIFLSPFGQTPQNENFKTISYQQLSVAFNKILPEIGSEYVRYFVNSWINISAEIGRQ
jgi:hypothetical protein